MYRLITIAALIVGFGSYAIAQFPVLDISSETNLSVSGPGIELADDTVQVATGYSIPTTVAVALWNATNALVTASSSQWSEAFSWGDHSEVGYLTSEADPIFASSSAADIEASDISNWNAAAASTTALTPPYIRGLFSETVTGLSYSNGVLSLTGGYVIPLSASTSEWATAHGWGDHSQAGYLTSIATSSVRGMLSGTSPITYNASTGAFGFSNPGYITGLSWGDITGTLSNQTDLQAALNAKQNTLTTGNLTENITGLEFSATRQVIGGAAQLSLSSGYTIPLSASTSQWATAYGWGNHATAGYLTAIATSSVRAMLSANSPITYNSGTGAIGFSNPGYITDYTVTEEDVTAHEAALTITESQISDLDHFTGADITGSESAFSGWDKNASDDFTPSTLLTDYGFTDNSDDWNEAYSWGNHADEGYLTSFTEADPIFSVSAAYGITSGNISNWNTAYGWGNHASQGYLTSIATSTVRGMLSAGTGLSYSNGQFANTGVTSIGGLTGAVSTSSLGLPTFADLESVSPEIATSSIRGMFSASSPLSYNSGTGAFTFSNPGYITGVSWGDISGTLSSQSDLQAALNAKLSTTTAASTYYLQTNPSGYITSSALTPYLSTTTAAATYYPLTNPSGYTANTGTVTSVGLSVPTGLSVSGSPVTTSGTLAVSLTAGYTIPLSASTTNWDTAYGWGNHASAGYLTSVAASNLAAADFGDFTCNGTTCSLDTNSVADNEIDFSQVTLNDLTFDVGSVDKTEFGYLNGVTSAIQTQLNGKQANDFLLDDISALTDPNADRLLFWDDSDGNIVWLTAGSGLSISGTTISATGGSSAGDTAWATSTAGTDILLYPLNYTADVLFGSNATSSAGFWFDASATTTHIGNGGTGDSDIVLGPSGSEWTLGYDATDSTFAIASSTALGTNNLLSISKGGAGTTTVAALSITNAVSILGEYFTNFTTYVRSLFSAGTGLSYSSGQFSINQAANLTWTGQQNFGGASFLEIPNGTNPTANDPGELAHDTTDNQLILDDFVIGKATEKIWSATIASTSPAFISGGLLKVPTELDGYTMTAIRCSVQGGTSKVIAVEDESGNSTEDITCGTSVTSDDGSITNASVTAAEEMYIDFGSTSGSVDYVSISVFGRWTRE